MVARLQAEGEDGGGDVRIGLWIGPFLRVMDLPYSSPPLPPLVGLPPLPPTNIAPVFPPLPSGQLDSPGPGEYDPAAFRDTGPAFTMGTLPKVWEQGLDSAWLQLILLASYPACLLPGSSCRVMCTALGCKVNRP